MMVKTLSPSPTSNVIRRALRPQWICSQCTRKLAKRQRLGSKTNSDTSRRRVYSTFSKDHSQADHHSSLTDQTKTKKPEILPHGGRNIFSLIQPTGVPHLGNYLGALRQWKQFQDQKTRNGQNHSLTFGLADLHSLTLKQDPQTRRQNIRATYISLLAIGLDPAHCTLFIQSQIPQHSELMWLLSTVASTGYLSRMTQWKTKLDVSSNASMETLDEKSRDALRLSLFSYPVLQAADILLHETDLVPVGEDQAQHVEFTRQLARSFNAEYGNVLRVPETLISPAKRIMSLKDPTRKMSKSDPTKDAAILITDGPDEIRRKIKHAITDSVEGELTYDPVHRPGVANLFDILRHTIGTGQSGEEITAEHATKTKAQLKELVALAVANELEGVPQRFRELMEQDSRTGEVREAQLAGYIAATHHAGDVLQKVKHAMGLPVNPIEISI